MLSNWSKVIIYVVFICLFIVQKKISLWGRLCFFSPKHVVVVAWRLIKILMSFGHRVGHLANHHALVLGLTIWFRHGWPRDPGLSKQWHFLEEFQLKHQGNFSLWLCGLKNIFLSLCLAMD